MTPDLALPRSTYEVRGDALRAHLAQTEIDCALILGQEPQYWLTGYDTFLGAVLPQALVFPVVGEPVFVLWDADVAIAHQTSLVQDIRTYRFGVDDPAVVIGAAILRQMPDASRIGIDLSSHMLPYAFGRELMAAIKGPEVVDITLDLARMRSVKIPEELALMRKAGSYADAGLAAARQHLVPGATEIAVAGEIEYAMRRAGSDYATIPTELSSGPRSVQAHGAPTTRRLKAGDLVHIEIGGVERRYNAVGIQTMVVPGAPPSTPGKELYEIARESLRRGLEQLRPNVPAAEVEAPALEVIRTAGQGDNFKMRFGYGVGIGFPPSWLEPLKITRTSTDVLVPGTTFVLHACLLNEAEQIGVLVGGTYAITDDGYEMLAGAGDVALE